LGRRLGVPDLRGAAVNPGDALADKAGAMSMMGNFLALPDEELRALFANPEGVERLLYASFFGDSSNGHDELEIDKSWHGLHFLLTGSAEEASPPLNFILAGGEEVGDDLGYGPARAFRSDDVRGVDAALEPLTAAELRGRFDADRMTELQIYPFGWSEDPDGELEYLLEFYGELRAFVRRTAGRGHGLLVYLS
jgi:hypothetical protein